MQHHSVTVTPDRDAILGQVVDALDYLTSDWDLELSGGIGSETRLVGDLMFESIDMVNFIVMLEQRFERTDLPFEDLLIADGQYVEDLRVADVAEFLDRQLAA